jgi:hypothetical protein
MALQNAITALAEGKLTTIASEIRVIRRNFVMVTAATYATEPTPKRRSKLKAADEFAHAYDRQIDQGATPAMAEEVVLAKIAIP